MAKDKGKKVKTEGLDQSAKDSSELNEGELDEITGGVTDGISSLIQVPQTKSNNANDEAIFGAQSQKSLINSQKKLRNGIQAFQPQKISKDNLPYLD